VIDLGTMRGMLLDALHELTALHGRLVHSMPAHIVQSTTRRPLSHYALLAPRTINGFL
jgi:hypothetical protein